MIQPVPFIMKNITFKQLRVFCALYELRNFTTAARSMNMTQSAVSKLCAELEDELGQPLFERSTRSVLPCDGACDFYAYARDILGVVRSAERSMSGRHALERGNVAIATSPLMMTGLLGEVITAFHMSYPGIKLELFELSTDDTMDYVREGRADFGIVSQMHPVEQLSARIIYNDTIYVVCPPKHPLARKESVSWQQLAEYEQIVLHNANSVRRILDYISANLGLTFRYGIEVGMLTTVLDLVKSDLGVSIIPGYACKFAKQLGLIVNTIHDSPYSKHALWLIQRKESRPSLAAMKFLAETEKRIMDMT